MRDSMDKETPDLRKRLAEKERRIRVGYWLSFILGPCCGVFICVGLPFLIAILSGMGASEDSWFFAIFLIPLYLILMPFTLSAYKKYKPQMQILKDAPRSRLAYQYLDAHKYDARLLSHRFDREYLFRLRGEVTSVLDFRTYPLVAHNREYVNAYLPKYEQILEQVKKAERKSFIRKNFFRGAAILLTPGNIVSPAEFDFSKSEAYQAYQAKYQDILSRKGCTDIICEAGDALCRKIQSDDFLLLDIGFLIRKYADLKGEDTALFAHLLKAAGLEPSVDTDLHFDLADLFIPVIQQKMPELTAISELRTFLPEWESKGTEIERAEMYREASAILERPSSRNEYRRAMDLFSQLGSYKDSAQKYAAASDAIKRKNRCRGILLAAAVLLAIAALVVFPPRIKYRKVKTLLKEGRANLAGETYDSLPYEFRSAKGEETLQYLLDLGDTRTVRYFASHLPEDLQTNSVVKGIIAGEEYMDREIRSSKTLASPQSLIDVIMRGSAGLREEDAKDIYARYFANRIDWNYPAINIIRHDKTNSRSQAEKSLQHDGFSPEVIAYALDNCGVDWKEHALNEIQYYIRQYDYYSRSDVEERLLKYGFTDEEIAYAMDNCGADWKERAPKKAEWNLRWRAYSRSGMIKQLEQDGFTDEEIAYAVENCGADWKEQALKRINDLLPIMRNFPRSALEEELAEDGYTDEEIAYAAENCGADWN